MTLWPRYRFRRNITRDEIHSHLDKKARLQNTIFIRRDLVSSVIPNRYVEETRRSRSSSSCHL
ncbi:hypothetical protein BDV35DRAFT_345265 [Aspergillus flavus]|nr:hypothetical protein BDV35DRAFT_345265 [Aspergillus flavus]